MLSPALILCLSAVAAPLEATNALCSTAKLAHMQTSEFLSKAKELREKEAWAELAKLAEAQTKTDAEQNLAFSFLAIAHAGNKNFDDAYQALKNLQDKGVDLDSVVEGLGSPMVEVVNAIYAHCWANFDPTFNRQCWQRLYDDFGSSEYAPIAASRLLMADLKEKNESGIKKYSDFFEQRIQLAIEAKDAETEADLGRRYVDGYLRAMKSNARIAELAQAVWSQAWQTASEQYSYEGPMGGVTSQGVALETAELNARRECEIDTDNAFNTIALATYLSGEKIQPGHPLYAMEAEPSVSFEDCTEEIGLAGLRIARVAAADFDQDGDPDLSLCGQLFENRNGKFINVGKERGVTQTGLGSVFGDFDGDGYLDLLIAKGGNAALYRNLGKRGKYRFEDATTSSGLNNIKLESSPEGAAWVDFDDDGDLDIYFALYEDPMSVGHHDVLAVNQGDGTFIDRSKNFGLHTEGPYCGRGVSPCDVDHDGHSDIFVSNYRLQPNLHWQWLNSGFVDASAEIGIKGMLQPADGQYYGHTIGSCWGDVDNDGHIDLFSANLAHPRFIREGFSNQSMLCMNQGDGNFVDEAVQRGLRFQETNSDPALIDIDNDGDLDLSITNIYEGVPSALFQNDGSGNFQPITFRANAASFHAWGQTWLDFDGDGFLDVIYASSNGVRALRNLGNSNHHLRIALQSKGSDTSAFGAIVTVTTMEEEQPRQWVRQLHNVRGTTSQDEPIVHFGLGDYAGRVEVIVRWPDSDRTQKKTPKPDRVYLIKQSQKAR
jgi:hypothetical protein